MRKLTLLAALALTIALPADAARGRHESYFSYDDGGTLVRQGEDGREIDARINLPVFPGDEVITNRRGRAEIVLADGNILAVDRATAIRFRSIQDSFDGEDDETIAELRYGKVMLYRTDEGRESVRLDTTSATYFASREAIFSVETDSRGADRLSVFEGTVEVRTPARTTRVRRGEVAQIDDRGLYDYASGGTTSADDFERWFLRRSERYERRESRYLDRSLAYYEDELSRHGSWVFVNGYGWGWRPTISVGWRPYYHGYWTRGRSGCLTWVSYEPWGWVPYHYGRWSYDPFYGWFWLPGAGYAPAWVYWWYGNGYIGWAPSGWYDAYRPYYNWAYRPYQNVGLSFGFGFYGRVRVNEVDLRPWTFVEGNTLLSNRIDRAALTTDAVRSRLSREPGGMATISMGPARFTREEYRDPAAAINRRWTGADTGRERTPAGVDMTPFFRRDPELAANIRDRVIRTRPNAPSASGRTIAGADGGVAPIGSGSLAPTGRGGLAPVDGGAPAPIGREGLSPIGPSDRLRRPDPVDRGEAGREPRERALQPESREGTTGWRERLDRSRPTTPRSDAPQDQTAPAPRAPRQEESWRGRIVRGESGTSAPAERSRDASVDRGESDVPRRVIDRIGGARLVPPEGDRSRSRDSEAPRPRSIDRSSSGSRERSAPPPSRSGGSVERAPSSRESAPPPPRQRESSGGNRSDGGRIERKKD